MKSQYLYFGAGALAIFAAWRYSRGRYYYPNITNQLPKNGSWKWRPVNEVTDITLHHTASGPDWTPERLANLHIKDRKWPRIAYHFLIYEDGRVFQTNNLESHTYHNGYNNSKAIGIAMVGNYQTGYPTKKQIDSVVSLCKYLKRSNTSITRLIGHKEYPGASTACPGGNINISKFRELCGLVGPGGKATAVSVKTLSEINQYNPEKADN